MASNTNNLPPNGPWNINYDADVCQLARTFGSGKDRVLLQLQSYNMQTGLHVLIAGNAFATKHPIPLPPPATGKAKQKYLGEKPGDAFRDKFTIQFGPVGKEQEFTPRAAMLRLSADEEPVPALMGGETSVDDRHEADPTGMTPERVEAPDTALEAAVTWVQVRMPDGALTKLATGSLAQPLAALHACSTDLVKSWGIPIDDPALAPVVLPAPRTSPAQWVTWKDFPVDELRAKTNAMVRFRLMVDAKGKVTSCHIQDATRNVELTRVTCQLLKARAAFNPARNAAGGAVPGYYTNALLWASPQ